MRQDFRQDMAVPKPPTSKLRWRLTSWGADSGSLRHGGWLCLLLLWAVGSIASLRAQPTSAPPADPLAQLMVTQPSIEVVTNPVATAVFDPPMVRLGDTATLRVTFNALEDSIEWPEQVTAPPQLKLRLSARGQMFVPAGDKLKPFTAINQEVRALETGSFDIPQFVVRVYDRPVVVPAARLEVVAADAEAPPPPPRLVVELAETNVYAGQAVSVRVSAAQLPQGLTQVKLNGDGFLVDHGAARQTMTISPVGGRNVLTFIHETSLTPLAAGKLTFSAQGFAGSRLGGVVLTPGQPPPPVGTHEILLLDSPPVSLNVRPLPPGGPRRGFTGAIGNFTCDPPQLSTDRARVGELVKLHVTFRGEGNLARFVPPPAPRHSAWQTSAPVPGGPPTPPAPPTTAPGGLRKATPPGPAVTFTYTLMPMTESVQATPEIPFSFFDPQRGIYVDSPIPSVPIKVLPGVAGADLSAWTKVGGRDMGEEEEKLALSPLAVLPGRSASTLLPLQHRGWFVAVQLLPVFGFTGLWAWDRRRKYLELHPDVVLRRRARRALRRERRALERAVRAGDPVAFVRSAVRAMRVACAPHFPAEPRALVGRDVQALLGGNPPDAEVVRRFFAVADQVEFSFQLPPGAQVPAGAASRSQEKPDVLSAERQVAESGGLLALQPDLNRVLAALEARL